jgi:hypothetical protein
MGDMRKNIALEPKNRRHSEILYKVLMQMYFRRLEHLNPTLRQKGQQDPTVEKCKK